jgi:hypothetical protein
MVFGRGNSNDLEDRPSNDDAPPVATFVPLPKAAGLNPERSWLYRSPGVPGETKGRSGRAQNPWTAAPPRPIELPSAPAPKAVVASVSPPMPPPIPVSTPPAFLNPTSPMPPPMPVLTPPAFLNPASTVGQDLYGHTPPPPPHEDPVVAVTKAVVSTVGLCLGFWFASSLYVVSLMLFFPYAFNGWEGNAIAIPGLGVSCAIALLMALWIGNQTSWWWGILTFFFLPIVFAVYVFKQNRGLVSRSGRPVAKFPTMVTIGSMIGIAIFVLIASFLFFFRNYSDEIARGDGPFDRYSYDSHLIDEPEFSPS